MRAFTPFQTPARHDLQSLKDRLTIPELWQRLGLPGTPRGTCRSPFRQDRSPSFSIYDEGRHWKDFGTGEGGDGIDFIARACAVDAQEATRRFLAMAGVPLPLPPSFPGKLIGHCSTNHCLRLPPLHRGTAAELEAVARSRQLSPAAVALAQSLGTLRFGGVCGLPCWVLGDPARRIAEARRVDRQPFPAIGDLAERKAHTLRGSAKSWPVGVAVLRSLPHFRAVMLVEGGPDYLAALHFCLEREVHDVLPVAMLGRSAGTHIDGEALALLQGRRVRVYPHNDADGGGMTSSQIWAAQLAAQGCELDLYTLADLSRRDSQPVNDLNDCSLISATDEPQLNDLLP